MLFFLQDKLRVNILTWTGNLLFHIQLFYLLNYIHLFTINFLIYVGVIRTLNSKYQKFMTYLLVYNIYILNSTMEILGLDPKITICKIAVLPVKLYPLFFYNIIALVVTIKIFQVKEIQLQLALNCVVYHIFQNIDQRKILLY